MPQENIAYTQKQKCKVNIKKGNRSRTRRNTTLSPNKNASQYVVFSHPKGIYVGELKNGKINRPIPFTADTIRDFHEGAYINIIPQNMSRIQISKIAKVISDTINVEPVITATLD